MKAVVAIPPIEDFYTTPHRLSALGALAVSSILSKKGWDVTLLNFPALTKKAHAICLPPAISYLQPFVKKSQNNELLFFKQYKRFGPAYENCAQQIVACQPELVCLSSFAFAYADCAILLAEAIKTLAPQLPVVVGGAGVSALPEYYLRSDAFDFVISGEAEQTIPQVLNYLGVNLVTSRYIYQAPDSYEVPWTVSCQLSQRQTMRISLSLSKGCPRSCKFCSNYISQGRNFRTVPLSEVERGIKALPEFAHTVFLQLEDDNLLYAPEYLLSVLRMFQAKYKGLQLSFENGIDYLLLENEMFDDLTKLGLSQLNISLGALDTKNASEESRVLNTAKYEKVIEWAAAQQLPVITYFIAGLKHDTYQSVLKAIGYLERLPTIIGISPFYAVPGLASIEGVSGKDFFLSHSARLCCGSSCYPWFSSLSTEELVMLFSQARRVNLGR